MAKKKRKRKSGNSARTKFGRAAKGANAQCHAETNSVSSYRTCMRREMKKRLKKEGFKVGR